MSILRHRKGQGTTEYILVIGIAVAIAVAVLWTKMRAGLNTKVDTIVRDINAPRQ
jgi:hypothetical protein